MPPSLGEVGGGGELPASFLLSPQPVVRDWGWGPLGWAEPLGLPGEEESCSWEGAAKATEELGHVHVERVWGEGVEAGSQVRVGGREGEGRGWLWQVGFKAALAHRGLCGNGEAPSAWVRPGAGAPGRPASRAWVLDATRPADSTPVQSVPPAPGDSLSGSFREPAWGQADPKGPSRPRPRVGPSRPAGPPDPGGASSRLRPPH